MLERHQRHIQAFAGAGVGIELLGGVGIMDMVWSVSGGQVVDGPC